MMTCMARRFFDFKEGGEEVVAYLRVLHDSDSKMEVCDQLCVLIRPVLVEFRRRDALFAVVEELDVKHSFHVHGAGRFVG